MSHILDSNKDKIVEILVKNCAEKSRLNKLSEKYKKKYAKDLLEDINPIMEAGVQEALDAILAPSAEFDAKCLNDAIKVHIFIIVKYLCRLLFLTQSGNF